MRIGTCHPPYFVSEFLKTSFRRESFQKIKQTLTDFGVKNDFHGKSSAKVSENVVTGTVRVFRNYLFIVRNKVGLLDTLTVSTYNIIIYLR